MGIGSIYEGYRGPHESSHKISCLLGLPEMLPAAALDVEGGLQAWSGRKSRSNLLGWGKQLSGVNLRVNCSVLDRTTSLTTCSRA